MDELSESRKNYNVVFITVDERNAIYFMPY